jgi:hypothetical protein
MILDRHEIHILEVSRDVYNQKKSRQKLKPTTTEKPDTIFGLITSNNSYSIGNFCRQVEDNLGQLRIMNKLITTIRRNKRVVLEREVIYENSEEDSKKLYSTLGQLNEMIREGRGIDLIFKNNDVLEEENSEMHFYKLKGNDLVLVEVRIPSIISMQGLYRFTRTTKDIYKTLKATQVPQK